MSTQAVAIYEPQTLMELEDSLMALVNSMDTVTPEQEEEYKRDFARALTSAVEKRDRVAQFLFHLEEQVVFAGREIDRLNQRKRTIARIQERLTEYVRFVIESFGRDAKGKYRKLEGQTSTFSLRVCPPSVDAPDETKVPDDYKSVTVDLPAFIWAQLLAAFTGPDNIIADELRLADRKKGVTVSKSAIRAAIEAGCTVEGARMVNDNYSVVVR